MLAVLAALFKPVILPIVTFVVGWLIPNPQQKAARSAAKTADTQADIHAAETKADQPGHNVTDLDKLP